MLKECKVLVETAPNSGVLILILMEHAQRALPAVKLMPVVWVSLNPYFNGTCSKSDVIDVEVEPGT